MPRRRHLVKQKRIARDRIMLLLRMADDIVRENPQLAERYGDIARRLSLRARVRIPEEYSWRYCRRCKKLMFPGVNAVVRLRSRRYPHMVIKCLRCRCINRRPYIREKLSKKNVQESL